MSNAVMFMTSGTESTESILAYLCTLDVMNIGQDASLKENKCMIHTVPTNTLNICILFHYAKRQGNRMINLKNN